MIRRKLDISSTFIPSFEQLAEWDGTKYYLLLEDAMNEGSLTIMKYKDGHFTLHRKNNLFWDLDERSITNDELIDIIWKNRKAVNRFLKQDNKVLVVSG
ncbi:hypothetical protein [Mesobacillus foraminis]|uniref:Uncharacterized protein n=1 Tax=Mesobacillus foraminis TaxID=279826 RepID=A0A4R2BHF5_9BACI|nr:hypothetical protein [Mesobacillus foraminis]TCN25459.1 hypothetical protein EV146_105116 [Mesobacillus foraminis]